MASAVSRRIASGSTLRKVRPSASNVETPSVVISRYGVSSCVAGHLPKLGNLYCEITTGCRDPAVAIADRASSTVRKSASDMDGRMRLLDRLRPRHNRIEADEFAVIFRLRLRPDLLHRFNALANSFEAALVHCPMVLHFILIPAPTDAE